MTDLEIRMLSMLSDALHEKAPAPIPENLCPALLKELTAQTIYALPSEYMAALSLPEAAAAGYLRNVLKMRRHFYRLMQDQKMILGALDTAGVPAVVLKGAAAAVYYRHPENRTMGDIDLLVLPEDFEKAYAALTASGCTASETPEDFHRHIHLFTENNTPIELHRYFDSAEHGGENSVLDKLLSAAIPERVTETVDRFEVPMLPALENGLVLLSHIDQHLSSGLGLRQIIDWMFYVEKELDDTLWESRFAALADALGLKRLAILVTAMCQKYLGLDKDIHWCAYEPACDELMEYILGHGNFGVKIQPTKSKAVLVLKALPNPIETLKVAQKRGVHNWKAVRKHPWLKPFAWCYQLIRWTRNGLKEGVSPKLLKEARDTADKESEKMDRFGAKRV